MKDSLSGLFQYLPMMPEIRQYLMKKHCDQFCCSLSHQAPLYFTKLILCTNRARKIPHLGYFRPVETSQRTKFSFKY